MGGPARACRSGVITGRLRRRVWRRCRKLDLPRVLRVKPFSYLVRSEALLLHVHHVTRDAEADFSGGRHRIEDDGAVGVDPSGQRVALAERLAALDRGVRTSRSRRPLDDPEATRWRRGAEDARGAARARRLRHRLLLALLPRAPPPRQAEDRGIVRAEAGDSSRRHRHHPLDDRPREKRGDRIPGVAVPPGS